MAPISADEAPISANETPTSADDAPTKCRRDADEAPTKSAHAVNDDKMMKMTEMIKRERSQQMADKNFLLTNHEWL